MVVLEKTLVEERATVTEMQSSTNFINGFLTAINPVFDEQIEAAKQAAFKLGYESHKKQIKDPKKPIAGQAGQRIKRLTKSK